MKKVTMFIGKKFMVIILGVVIFCVMIAAIIGIILAINFTNNAIKLYNDIGATPFKRPETDISAGSSARHSDEDIQSAMDTILSEFDNDWDNYNRQYLLKLWYDDEYSEFHEDGDSNKISFLSTIYVGYSYNVIDLTKGQTYDNWQWHLIKNDDGEWEIKGYGLG